ncbi:hypothetical protein [Photobacterium damselae]|uniref:hypothetical protein n=1 Tax=Photobacterium damselae TaxID=38293 RepID=UPI001F487872|nr:hypothetical protein [Photobacterium damselae]UKA04922.1 hypothetical protein IHC89_22010 [Photobacterium damselae subsp. damselae]
MSPIVSHLFTRTDLFPEGSVVSFSKDNEGCSQINFSMVDGGQGSFCLALTCSFLNVFSAVNKRYEEQILSEISVIGETGRKFKGFDTTVMLDVDGAFIKTKHHNDKLYRVFVDNNVDDLVSVLKKMGKKITDSNGLDSTVLDEFFLGNAVSERLDDLLWMKFLTPDASENN